MDDQADRTKNLRRALGVPVAAAAATGAVLAAAVLAGHQPATDGPQPRADGDLTLADAQQASMVVLAWHLNGPYSECMAERGFSVPWQNSIHLAEALQDDPDLVAQAEEQRHEMESDADVVDTEEFARAAARCRRANPPTDREGMVNPPTSDSLAAKPDHWAKVVAEARRHGWSHDDPFALTGG